ncbi:hypothetical protein BCR44DRAFT_1514657 [Catenaria anguillulae PL171]|uniref:Ankyrin repeat-containing domain protein n=1 Tax=Catenaria anguillulae PL171 TaxID=765915 RepID=A0A1Y2HFW8_9FUNG|nr:hypothetical protein BCR44DRAFT_1514657 [Catenaria anguillulae PL171]
MDATSQETLGTLNLKQRRPTIILPHLVMSPVSLTLELAELVLVHAAHLAHATSLEDPEPVARVLNVALRNDMPNVTKRVLWDFAWVTADTACEIGDVELLKLLIDWDRHNNNQSVGTARPLEMTVKAVDLASANGHTHVLDFLFGTECRLDPSRKVEWSIDAMDGASANGHISSLDWWLHSGKELKYSPCAMDSASANADFVVLNWWRKNVQHKWYSSQAMGSAAQKNRIDVLEWWFQSGLHLIARMCSQARQKAAMCMSWIGLTSNLASHHAKEFEYRSDDVSLTTIAVEHGNFVALLWLDAEERVHVRGEHVLLACKTVTCPSSSLSSRIATQHGRVAVLDWLLQNKCPIDESANYLEVASRIGSVELLEWWSKNTPATFNFACKKRWWKRPSGRTTEFLIGGNKRGSHKLDESMLAHLTQFESVKFGMVACRARAACIPSIGSFELVDDCTHKGKLSLLEWLHRWTSGSIKCSSFKFCGLDLRQQTLVVHWWASRGHPLCGLDLELDIQGTVPFVLLAALGHKGLLATLPTIDLDLLSANGDLQGLQFAVTSGANLVYSDKALSIASEKQLLAVLEWWLHSSVPIKLPNMESATWMRWNGPESVKKWWTDHLAKLQARVG